MSDDAPNILIVDAPYYADIAAELLRGTVQELDAQGAGHELLEVFGAFEIPAAIALAAQARHDDGRSLYDGFIALGCVIRGETTHYDYICGESARGLMDLSVQQNLAIGYGILTCENREQAWDRAAVDRRNKGKDAATACLGMVALRRRYGVDMR